MHKFENLINLSFNISELNFYQDQNKMNFILITFEIDKSESDRIFDPLIYKNHYASIKKVHVLLGEHNTNFIC